MSIRIKAIIITLVLAAALLAIGLETGKYLSRQYIEDARELTSQATEKVLVLTQQNRLLEEKLQELEPVGLGDRQGYLWPDGNSFYGLLHLKQQLALGSDLTLLLESIDQGEAVLRIIAGDEQSAIHLLAGKPSALNNNWRITITYLQKSWAVFLLSPL